MHVTRGFYLDRSRPDLLTLYMQSASGGLYAGDRLKLDVALGPQAALHLTTQAATVVHDGRRGRVRSMRHSVTVQDRAFCAMISDPYILFPGASLHIATIATVAADAILIMAEGFAVHDPHRRGGTFARFAAETRIMRPDGQRVVVDRGSICGSDLSGNCDALGGMSAACSVLVIAPPDRLADIAEIEAAADQMRMSRRRNRGTKRRRGSRCGCWRRTAARWCGGSRLPFMWPRAPPSALSWPRAGSPGQFHFNGFILRDARKSGLLRMRSPSW